MRRVPIELAVHNSDGYPEQTAPRRDLQAAGGCWWTWTKTISARCSWKTASAASAI